MNPNTNPAPAQSVQERIAQTQRAIDEFDRAVAERDRLLRESERATDALRDIVRPWSKQWV